MDLVAEQIDLAFVALADKTRRRVLERLSQGPATVSELAKPFAMAMPSFLQHLQMLERCGLITSQKQGRVRRCHLQPRTLQQVEGWLSLQRQQWETRLDQLDDYLTRLKEQQN